MTTKLNADIVSFTSPLQTKLVLTLTEEIISQSEPGKHHKNQSSERKFYNVSHFELKILQQVRF